MKRHIPNAITLLNLLCGVMACISAVDGLLTVAAYYIAAGAVFDLLDGMVARALGVSHELGKQLDSLADMVSFGVAPALMARELVFMAIYHQTGNITMETGMKVLYFLPLIIAAASALRLAKFNIDTEQSVDFLGLPTPANALFWLAIPLSFETGVHQHGMLGLYQNAYVLCGLAVFLSLLLVSRIRLFSLKIDRQDKSRIKWQLMLITSAVVLFAIFRFAALPMVIVLYLLLSLIRNTTLDHEIQS